jgi:hypothetical protein
MKQALLPFLLKRTPEAAAPEGVSNTADDTGLGTGSGQLGAGVSSGDRVMAGDTAGVITDVVDVDVDVAVAVSRPTPPPQAVITTATIKGKIRRKGARHREAVTLDIRVSYCWSPLKY